MALWEAAAVREILEGLLGRTLLTVAEARHWRDGVRGEGDEALIDFWLHFDGMPAVHVCGDDSGTRLLVTYDEPYPSYDMGRYGEFRVGSPQRADLLSQVAGHRLVDAAILGDRVGVLLRFDHRDLAVVECDDDFVFSTSVPEGLPVGSWLGAVS
jgi:hypothetical protein